MPGAWSAQFIQITLINIFNENIFGEIFLMRIIDEHITNNFNVWQTQQKHTKLNI